MNHANHQTELSYQHSWHWLRKTTTRGVPTQKEAGRNQTTVSQNKGKKDAVFTERRTEGQECEIQNKNLEWWDFDMETLKKGGYSVLENDVKRQMHIDWKRVQQPVLSWMEREIKQD